MQVWQLVSSLGLLRQERNQTDLLLQELHILQEPDTEHVDVDDRRLKIDVLLIQQQARKPWKNNGITFQEYKYIIPNSTSFEGPCLGLSCLSCLNGGLVRVNSLSNLNMWCSVDVQIIIFHKLVKYRKLP